MNCSAIIAIKFNKILPRDNLVLLYLFCQILKMHIFFKQTGECSSYYENSPKTLTSSSGVFSSPRWPSDYPILRDCYWRIDVDVGKNVKIAVMDLDLEYDSGCDNDKLKIKGK